MKTEPRAIFVLMFLGTACTETPLTAPTTTSATDTSGSPTSFDLPDTHTTGSTVEPTTSTPTTSSGSTSDETTTTTTGDGSVCGDGVVAGDEECDLGAENANTGACTLECKLPACGDGLVHAGTEECDFGLGNDESYGGCNPVTCTFGPHCGDGILDPAYEACDRGELNGTGMTPDELAPCTYTCGFFGRILFITSQTWNGDLGGVSGGDLKCQAAAAAAGLPNPSHYRAWLSDDFQSPATRFEQWSAPDIPVILVGGRVVAADLAELVEHGPRTGIARTESGDALMFADTWTNTSAFGEIFSITNHCAGWTSTSSQLSARIGLNALADEDSPEWETWLGERWWTSLVGLTCNKPAHLYCIDDGILLDEED